MSDVFTGRTFWVYSGTRSLILSTIEVIVGIYTVQICSRKDFFLEEALVGEGGISSWGIWKRGNKKLVPVMPILIAQVSQTPADISLQRSALAKRLCSSGCGPAVCDRCLI